MAMLALLKRMEIEATVHGTSHAGFETRATETGKPNDITEATLNHTQGKLNEAYSLGTARIRRAGRGQNGANVTHLKRYTAVDRREMAPVMAQLAEQEVEGVLVLHLAVLTACCTQEVLGGRWN
jgi:uncharacterized Zn finger protein